MNQKAFTVDEYHDTLGQTERPIFDVSVSGFIVPAHPELGAFQRSYKDAVCALAKSRGISLSEIQTCAAEQEKSKVESFMDLLKKADSVELSCSPLLSGWSTDSVKGVPSNEIVSFAWVDEESATYQLALTEEGVANGKWIGDKFVCEDSEGDEVQITLNVHIAITFHTTSIQAPVIQATAVQEQGKVEGRFSLSDLYAKWDALGDVPIDGDDCIEEVFLDFRVGTHREGIWQWFERQHPLFIVGDVMQGIRHQDDGKVQLLQSYGYFAGARDPKVKPEFSGRYMVRDTEDDADGFCIVGDDLGALVREAIGCLEIASSPERGNVQNVSIIKVVVACRNASGSSDMPVFDVAATQDQIDLGEHYDLAEKMASEAGYEAPFVCFDPQEVPALKRALEAYGNHAEKAHDDVTPGM